MGDGEKPVAVDGDDGERVDVALMCLPKDNIIRKPIIVLIEWKWFDRFILSLIMLNSIVLAMVDYSIVDSNGDPSLNSWRNSVGVTLEPVFTWVFVAECLLKIIGLGFVMSKGSYLRDAWNCMDFLIVVAGLVTLLPNTPNLTALRTVRVLRPLKTLSKFPGMRALVTSLLKSLPGLGNVILLFFFVFFIFGILGVQLWAGLQHARCRLTEWPVTMPENCTGDLYSDNDCWQAHINTVVENPDGYRCLNNTKNVDTAWSKSSSPWSVRQNCFWPMDLEDTRICSLPEPGIGSHQCFEDVGLFCGSNYDNKGNPRFLYNTAPYGVDVMVSGNFIEDLAWGYTTFDDFPMAFLTIFQAITEEGWVDIMYQLEDGFNRTVTQILFLALILFGSWFMMNLVLAVITDSVDDANDEVDEQEAAANESENIETPTTAEDQAEDVAGADEQRGQMYSCVTGHKFSGFVVFAILANTVVLAMDHKGMSTTFEETLEVLNFCFSMIFLVEMVLKIAVLGFKEYVNDAFNVFDAVVVVVSLLELAVAPPSFMASSDGGGGGGGFTALRSFRLFRVFKLAKDWASLQTLLKTIIKTLYDVANFAVLLLLFMYIFSLVGMQLFANKMHFQPDSGATLKFGEEGYATADIPRHNFDDFLWSFVTIFQVLSGENWNAVMYDCWRAAGVLGPLYFLALNILGGFIVMNLFLAILLCNFEGNDDLIQSSDAPRERAGLLGSVRQLSAAGRKSFAHMTHMTKYSASSKVHPGNGEEGAEEVGEKRPSALPKALWIFGYDNPLRMACVRITNHDIFTNTIMVLIIVSSIALAIENPLQNENDGIIPFLRLLDYFFTTIFALEMVLKIVAKGYALHRGSYIRDPWNVLDFVIVVVSVLSLAASGSDSGNLKSLRSLRTLRVLRPLRMINRQPGLKLVVNALLQALPNVMNVVFIVFLFFLIFAIMGVNYFKGKFYECQGDTFDSFDDGVVDLLTTPQPWLELTPTQKAWFEEGNCSAVYSLDAPGLPTSKEVCLCLGAEWASNCYQDFDDVFHAIAAFFELSTTEGWVDVMYRACDATAEDMQPIRNYNEAWTFFFIAFIIVGSFFAMNLFVGVIIDSFNVMKERQENSGGIFMTEEQKEWCHNQRLIMKIKPRIKKPRPTNALSAQLFDLVEEPRFDHFVMSCIVLNTIVMAMDSFDKDDGMAAFIEIGNYLFALVFTVEAVLKMIALRWRYFDENWNRFDFLIVLGTDVGLVVKWTTPHDLGSVVTVIRTFRLGRMLRLINAAKSLRILFNTLILALPSMGNIAGLLGLLYFIYAVMGVQLFAKVALNEALNEQANFQTFGAAFVVLFRSSTGENWNGMMYDMSIKHNEPDFCVNDPDYDENWCLAGDVTSSCTPINGCGAPFWLCVIYWYTFTTFVTYVMLNLFIGIILDAFGESDDGENAVLNDAQMSQFVDMWVEFDPRATWFIQFEQLKDFLQTLETPMGFGVDYVASDDELLRRIANLDIPVQHRNEVQVVHVRDLAMALGKFVMRKDLERRGKVFEDLPATHDVYHRWRKRQMSAGKLELGGEDGESSGQHTVKAHFAAMKIQDNWKGRKGDDEEGGSAQVACDGPPPDPPTPSNGEAEQKAAPSDDA